MRVALVAIGRLENDYAREFVEHHLGVGFDHVIIADNNRDGEERFEDVLRDYLGGGTAEHHTANEGGTAEHHTANEGGTAEHHTANEGGTAEHHGAAEGRVVIEGFRGMEKAQRMAYNTLYEKYSALYDWIAFFDFDEFLCLGDGLTSVKELLARHEGKADVVMVPWMMMTDSGLIRKDARPLMERFTERAKDVAQGKCIVRGGIKGLRFTNSVHVPLVPALRCVTPTGKPTGQTRHQPCDFTVAWLKHFSTKTIEEWVTNKWRKGAAGVTYERFTEQYRDYFFKINERTEEKERVVEELRKTI